MRDESGNVGCLSIIASGLGALFGIAVVVGLVYLFAQWSVLAASVVALGAVAGVVIGIRGNRAKRGRSTTQEPVVPGGSPPEHHQDTLPPARSAEPVSPPPPPPPNHEPGWEYVYFASELARGIEDHESEYKDFDIGFVRPTGERVADPKSDLSERSHEIMMTVGNIDRLLSGPVMEKAFGPLGTPGDAETIARVSAGIVEVYTTMIAWAERVRGATVPSEWQPVYAALSDFVRQPLRQIREFSAKLTQAVDEVVAALRADQQPKGKVELTLEISIDPAASKAFDDALARVR